MEGGSEKDETRSQKIVANFFYFDFMRVLIAKRSREGQNFICQFFFYLLLFIFSATTQIRSSLSISVSLAHRLTYSHINAYVHMRVKNKKKKINKTKKKHKTRRQKTRRGDTRECKIFRTRPNGNNLSRSPPPLFTQLRLYYKISLGDCHVYENICECKLVLVCLFMRMCLIRMYAAYRVYRWPQLRYNCEEKFESYIMKFCVLTEPVRAKPI